MIHTDWRPMPRNACQRAAWTTLFLALSWLAILAGPVWAASASFTELVFPIGSGPQELGFVSLDPDGPDQGPVAILPASGGILILDAPNRRLMHCNQSGHLEQRFVVPEGLYRDMTSDTEGAIRLADQKQRRIYKSTDTGFTKAFDIPLASGPRQFDFLQCHGRMLVIGDFATRALYWYQADGTLAHQQPWPISFSLHTAPNGHLAFLAKDAEQRCRTLLFLDETGKTVRETVLVEADIQPLLDSARLLGFAPDGKAVNLAWTQEGPARTVIFLANGKGQTRVLAEIPEFPALAGRYGAIVGNHLWINTTSIRATAIRFRIFPF
jgi:hypothetical protein